MELAHARHCVYKIRYHMVFQVKYRKVLLDQAVEKCIRETMVGINERYNIIIDEIGFDQDHIHIFCGASPTKSPMTIYTAIKSLTARMVFAKFPAMKMKELWGGEFWSDGKYVGTVGDRTNEEIVRRYIQNQSPSKPREQTRFRQLKLFKI